MLLREPLKNSCPRPAGVSGCRERQAASGKASRCVGRCLARARSPAPVPDLHNGRRSTSLSSTLSDLGPHRPELARRLLGSVGLRSRGPSEAWAVPTSPWTARRCLAERGWSPARDAPSESRASAGAWPTARSLLSHTPPGSAPSREGRDRARPQGQQKTEACGLWGSLPRAGLSRRKTTCSCASAGRPRPFSQAGSGLRTEGSSQTVFPAGPRARCVFSVVGPWGHLL